MAIASALVLGGLAAGGAVLSSRSQKKGAARAADTAANTARSNNALARENMQFSAARLDPYAARGNEAGNAINALLGLGAPQAQPYGTAPATGGPSLGDISAMWTDGIPGNAAAAERQMRTQQPVSAAPAPGSVAAPNAMGAYNDAFQNYLGSTGYQFQMDQGNKAINQGYAANGSLQSGAALKALQLNGQNTGKNFFKDYLGLLANQQGVGLSGASAVAGVGQNYVNAVSANNNSMGSAMANSQLSQAQANGQMWSSLGGIAGRAFGSSYGG